MVSKVSQFELLQIASLTTSGKLLVFDFSIRLVVPSGAWLVLGILGDTKPISSESRSEAHASVEHESPIKCTSQSVDSIHGYWWERAYLAEGFRLHCRCFLSSNPFNFYCYFGINNLWNWFNWQYLLDEAINKFSKIKKAAIYSLQRPWHFDNLISWCDAGGKRSIKLTWKPVNIIVHQRKIDQWIPQVYTWVAYWCAGFQFLKESFLYRLFLLIAAFSGGVNILSLTSTPFDTVPWYSVHLTRINK